MAGTGGRRAAHGARLDLVLELWQTACLDGEGANAAPFRPAEAGAFVRAVLSSLDSWDGRALEVAAAGWARSVRSLPVLNARLASLRRVLEEHTEATERSRLEEVLGTAGALAIQTALLDLENAALTDSLTGAGNRRALETAASVALAEAARTGQALSIAVIDLDGLKTLNDTSGHSAGDAALAKLAETVRGAFRATDQLFRIGGDEFVVLLPLAGAEAVAEMMARARHLGAPRFSWGSATVPADGTDLETLLAVADSRLYAKRRAARYQDSLRTPRTAAAAGALPATWTAPAKRRHFGRAALVAGGSAAVVAVLAFVLGAGGSSPPVGNLPPGQGPASTSPAGAGTGSGPGGTGSGSPQPGGASTSGSGTSGSGTSGSGTSGSGTSGENGTGSSSGTGSTGTSSGGTSTPTTVPATTPTTAPVVTVPTVPGGTGGSSLLPGTSTTTTVPSGLGGLLGSLGNTVSNTTSGLGNTLGNTLNNLGSLLP